MPERCLICGTYSRGSSCARCGAPIEDEVDTSGWDVVERTTVSDDAGLEAIVGTGIDGDGLSLAVAAAIDAANHGTADEAERAQALARAAASAVVRREQELAMRAAMLRDEALAHRDAGGEPTNDGDDEDEDDEELEHVAPPRTPRVTVREREPRRVPARRARGGAMLPLAVSGTLITLGAALIALAAHAMFQPSGAAMSSTLAVQEAPDAEPSATATVAVAPSPTLVATPVAIARAAATPLARAVPSRAKPVKAKPKPAPRALAAAPKARPAPKAATKHATPAHAAKSVAAAPSATPATRLPWEEDSPASAASRVIHSRRGDKPVEIHRNVALTSADGKTVVGQLLDVKDGVVDVKTSSSVVRIAEKNVLDAANY